MAIFGKLRGMDPPNWPFCATHRIGRASLVAVQNPCVVVVGQPRIEIQAEPTVCWAVRVADKTPARLITARRAADRRWHRFDQDMVRADVSVLGASEPAAREIAGLLSGAGRAGRGQNSAGGMDSRGRPGAANYVVALRSSSDDPAGFDADRCCHERNTGSSVALPGCWRPRDRHPDRWHERGPGPGQLSAPVCPGAGSRQNAARRRER